MQPLPHARLVPLLEASPEQVMPEPHPISFGSISQGMPLLRTNSMPVRAARSSIRGLPPLGGSSGSSGSITCHSSSLTSGLAISSSYPPPAFVRHTKPGATRPATVTPSLPALHPLSTRRIGRRLDAPATEHAEAHPRC